MVHAAPAELRGNRFFFVEDTGARETAKGIVRLFRNMEYICINRETRTSSFRINSRARAAFPSPLPLLYPHPASA
jgi:hypothetical protein